jgi:endonuclease/exonuclease/phosphatase (EEP) superfamily protein YafD
VELGAERAVEWAGHDPLVLGGDFNLRPGNDGGLFERLADRFGLGPRPASRGIDHLLARGLEVIEPPAVLPAGERELSGPDRLIVRLSDHAPVVASFGMR